MQLIYYVGTNVKVIKMLGNNLAKQSYTLQKYDVNKIQLTENTPLLIIDPCWCEQYFSIASIWQQYLKKEQISVKLLITGFGKIAHANYIDLLELPTKFTNFLVKASFVGEMPIFCMTNMDITQRLIPFFKGHGHIADNFVTKLADLKNTFHSIEYNFEMGNIDVARKHFEQYALVEYQGVMNRLTNYYALFKYLPFYNAIRTANEELSQLRIIFNKKIILSEIVNSNIHQKLQNIYIQLVKIDKDYVRPEF